MNLRICLLFIVLLNVMTVISPSALAQKAGDIYHKGWIDLNKNRRKDIYEDGAQPVNQRVNDLLRQMDITEKEPGKFTVLIGRSSEDIVLKKPFKVLKK